MESIFVSTFAVVLAEMGDKTQLLALLLAVKFRRSIPIVLGIFTATIFNHACAGALGSWISSALSPEILKWTLAVSFWAMGLWMLIPDKEDGDMLDKPWLARFGAFGVTTITFFIAEMGDKTQLATVALAAHYENAVLVVVGTTLGMLIADVPAVFIGNAMANRLPLKWIHLACAILFVGLGFATLLF